MNLRRSALLALLALSAAACGGDAVAETDTTAVPVTTTTSLAPTTNSTTTTTTTTVAGIAVDDEGRTIPAITGTALPQLPSAGADGAIGMTIPAAEGRGADGSLMSIGPNGEPQAIVFLAHWCPHCRDEVTEYSEWLATSSMPEGTTLVAVATAIDSLRQNYPPEDWFADEGWPVPTLLDPTNEVADAFGLTAFPFWVLVDGDGAVVIRGAGGIAPDAIAGALTTIVNGPTISG
ncbi:MAG: TlpA family protein disulfide reductase [Acidimicrobiia bacterium]|nr:TlpA family protein disulfide reductase [Acidimicrobiia bacterium]NNC75875.1 TlpA family protein disulfide reductase [Acidimicrobiia bacterium]